MKLNIEVTLTDDIGERAVLKGRIERHREDVAKDAEASFVAEWQVDRGDGDPVLFTTTVDLFDLTQLNMAALVAEALNEIPMDYQKSEGDYSEVEQPLPRDRSLFGEAARRLLHLPKAWNQVE